MYAWGVRLYTEDSEHSPAQLGDDHLSAKFVKLVPQVFILEAHLDARVRLAPRQPRRGEASTVHRRFQVVRGEAVGKGGLGGKAACGNTRTTVTLDSSRRKSLHFSTSQRDSEVWHQPQRDRLGGTVTMTTATTSV